MPTFLSPVSARRACLLILGLVGAAPAMVQAQIGHRPSQSPYEDVKPGQSVSLSAGWLAIARDPAGVAPDAAPFGQLRYDVAIGGPASLFARYTLATTQRALFAPSAVADKRKTGTPGVAMHVIDAGIDVALTGKKTWHHLIPSLTGGVGVGSDFAAVDSGGYQFGVKFALSYGLGLQYVRSSGLRLRLDATNFRWQYDYPDRYFVKATDGTSILSDTKNRSAWRGNWGLSAGVSFPVFR
ncbi:MAG: hypothetical protein IPP90_19115 [Gemmatimonadaceae bacterium]|nr:hypothetical protein [Gemmatimonadaceae bacterium]